MNSPHNKEDKMSRAKTFQAKWRKQTSDTMELAEKSLRDKIDNSQWYDDISGARELVDQAGMESVGMAVTHEGMILLQKIIQDSITKALNEVKSELPDMIKVAVRDELMSLVESNREEPSEPEEVVEEPKKEVLEFRHARFKDAPMIISSIQYAMNFQDYVTNEDVKNLVKDHHGILIRDSDTSNFLRRCMKQDPNLIKVERGKYRYIVQS